ncbi:unnamed protein product, partial [Polarella glacialis]
ALQSSSAERECHLCSYLNPAARMACEICQAPLPALEAAPPRARAGDSTANSGGPSKASKKKRGGKSQKQDRAPTPPVDVVTEVDEDAVEEREALHVDSAREEERRLLQSMGWSPDDDATDEDGGLEEWEIDAAQEQLISKLQAAKTHEGLRERAQREFEAFVQSESTSAGRAL